MAAKLARLPRRDVRRLQMHHESYQAQRYATGTWRRSPTSQDRAPVRSAVLQDESSGNAWATRRWPDASHPCLAKPRRTKPGFTMACHARPCQADISKGWAGVVLGLATSMALASLTQAYQRAYTDSQKRPSAPTDRHVKAQHPSAISIPSGRRTTPCEAMVTNPASAAREAPTTYANRIEAPRASLTCRTRPAVREHPYQAS